MPLPYNRNLTERAKQLRKDATPEENLLWYRFLKDYPIRFYRQKVIDHYIADFYCFKAKLVIELDGSQHYTEQGLIYDEIRTKTLEQYGLKILRFKNSEVRNQFESVCSTIDQKIRIALPPF